MLRKDQKSSESVVTVKQIGTVQLTFITPAPAVIAELGKELSKESSMLAKALDSMPKEMTACCHSLAKSVDKLSSLDADVLSLKSDLAKITNLIKKFSTMAIDVLSKSEIENQLREVKEFDGVIQKSDKMVNDLIQKFDHIGGEIKPVRDQVEALQIEFNKLKASLTKTGHLIPLWSKSIENLESNILKTVNYSDQVKVLYNKSADVTNLFCDIIDNAKSVHGLVKQKLESALVVKSAASLKVTGTSSSFHRIPAPKKSGGKVEENKGASIHNAI